MIDLEIFHKIQSQIKKVFYNFRMASESEKICILLKSVGNAPVLKKDKFMLGKTTKLRHAFQIVNSMCIPGITRLMTHKL